MQPYLLPYIGYWQLVNIADVFVVYDDVQYMKGGWINRNNFLVNKSKCLYTFSVKKDLFDMAINQREFSNLFQKDCKKFRNMIDCSYGKAPLYKEISNLLDNIFSYEDRNISSTITNSIKLICRYLKINTRIIASSSLNLPDTLTGEQRVIKINKSLGATKYINPIGGKILYNREYFKNENIELLFLSAKNIKYKQFNNEFIPHLSIVDVMMFNSVEKVKSMLEEYELL